MLGILTLIVQLGLNDWSRLRLVLRGKTDIRAECEAKREQGAAEGGTQVENSPPDYARLETMVSHVTEQGLG